MGDWDGLSPRARAFSVAALLHLTEVTGHRGQTRHCSGTAYGGCSAVSDANASSHRVGAAGVDPGVLSLHSGSSTHDPAADRLLPPSCPGGESDSAETSHWSQDSPGRAAGPAATPNPRSPPSWSRSVGSSGHLEHPASSSNHVTDGSGSAGHTGHDLTLLNIEERLGGALRLNSTGSPGTHNIPAKSFSDPSTDKRNRAATSFSSSKDFAEDAAPMPDLSVEVTKSPSSSRDLQRRGFSPSRKTDDRVLTSANETEERASDSGTASGDDEDPDGPNNPSTARDRLSDWPTAPDCLPQHIAVGGAPRDPTAAAAAGAAGAAAAVGAAEPHDADPLSGGSASGRGDPDRLSPREPTAAAEREPRLAGPAAAEEPKEPGLAGPAAAEEPKEPRLAGPAAAEEPKEPGLAGPAAAEEPKEPRLAGPAAAEEPKEPGLAELGITAELCSGDLWLEFHEHGTEMIITKMGRRMFPTVKVRLHGLRATDSYIVYMDIVPVDDKRYRYIYHSSEWAVAGPGDADGAQNRYIHPDSPASGRLWTSQGIVAFDKLKLTNRRVACSAAQKYRPRVHVQWTNDLVTPAEQQIDLRKSLTFSFRETEFITVTAYQNQEITRLKIASNPFAKGFRDIPANKRQHSPSSDSSGSSGVGHQRAAKRARQTAPPSSGFWNYSYPLPATHPAPLLCIDPFSPITLLQSYSLHLQSQQYEKR